MTNIRKRGGSYQIRVSCGYNAMNGQVSRTMTWKPPKGMTEKQAEKEAQRQAFLFEEKCMKGLISANVKFEEFAGQWFEEYAPLNLRNTTTKKRSNCRREYTPRSGTCEWTKSQAGTFSNSSTILPFTAGTETTTSLWPKNRDSLFDYYRYLIKQQSNII